LGETGKDPTLQKRHEGKGKTRTSGGSKYIGEDPRQKRAEKRRGEITIFTKKFLRKVERF